MTTFSKDSLQDQIERGEIFFGGYTVVAFGFGDTSVLIIETGTDDCYLNLDIVTPVSFVASLAEGGANTHSNSISLFNMRRSDITTTMGATAWNAGTISGSSVIANVVAPDGRIPATNPLNRESGIALKASSAYKLSILHEGTNDAYLNVGFFLREIK